MIKKVRFIKDYRCFKDGDTIEFREGLNLIVGDQGTGKSSLFGLILDLAREGSSSEASDILKVGTSRAVRTHSFDSEKDNPRTKSYLVSGNEFAQINSMFRSHGQVIRDIVQSLPKMDDPCVYFLDEPDMGLSPRSIYKTISLFHEVVGEGHQILAIVHNPLLIESAEQVYDMETRQWVSPSDYLTRQQDVGTPGT